MKLRILLQILISVYLIGISQAKIENFVPDVVNIDIAEELSASVATYSTMKFVEHLKTLYDEFVSIRETVPSHPGEIPHVLSLFNITDLDFLCGSCKDFVLDLRKIANQKRIEDILEDAIESICGTFLNKTVCVGAITSFGEIALPAVLNRTFDAGFVCEKFSLCPRSYVESTMLYAEEILKDKPPTNIPVPTKKSSYKILHLTDPHIDLEYKIGANAACNEPLCCRAEDGVPVDPSQGAQYWGTYGSCDIPLRTFDQFLQFVANNFDVDMIFWTGDNISHDVWHQSIANQTVNTYDATEDMLNYFPNTSTYPMFGNHETYPADEYDTLYNTSAWLTSRLSNMWAPWLDDQALNTFRKSTYYAQVNAEHNVKIIAVDTQACNNLNFYLIDDPTDPLNHLAWLRQELYDSESKYQTVFIIGHIPPGDLDCDSEWSARYRALIDRFTNIIRGQFYGHTHTDLFEVVRSYKDNSPVGVVYVAPSLTTFTEHEPSFRIFEVDTETNVLLNYYQYRLNLTKWNADPSGPIAWDVFYNFLEEYNVTDMSVGTYQKLANQIAVDPELMALYQFNLGTGTFAVGNISASDARHTGCFVNNGVYLEYFACLGTYTTKSDYQNFVIDESPGAWYEYKQN